MNCAQIIGRLTATPELKKTQSGNSVVSFTVAVNKPKKDGEEQQANFIDCVAWKATAELIAKYFEKGSQIGIDGRLETRYYETKDGKKIKVTEINVGSVTFCEPKKNATDIAKEPEEEAGTMKEIPDDDYPF